MGQALTLEVSQDVYQVLAERAQQLGQPTEIVAAEMLATASQYLTSDPIESLIGALDIDVHDWGKRHDYYLREPLLVELHGETGEDTPRGG